MWLCFQKRALISLRYILIHVWTCCRITNGKGGSGEGYNHGSVIIKDGYLLHGNLFSVFSFCVLILHETVRSFYGRKHLLGTEATADASQVTLLVKELMGFCSFPVWWSLYPLMNVKPPLSWWSHLLSRGGGFLLSCWEQALLNGSETVSPFSVHVTYRDIHWTACFASG